MSKDDSASGKLMQALLQEEAAIPPKPILGEPITGVVVNIQNNRILVEIAGTFMGIISGREAADGLGTAKNLNIGDEVEAHVVEEENDEGYYVLSLRKAGREKAWEKLMEMKESGETLEVPIRTANKGGLMTEFSGIRAFIPVSQLAPEHYPRVSGANSSEILARLQKYVGQKFTVKPLAVEKETGKLIFSEKEGINKSRLTALKKLKVGDKIKGKVSGVVNFGIFILFNDCLEGLVHLSEIAWGRVTDPANYARLGEEMEALVIGIETGKISLSIRRLTPDPWLDLVKDYKVGDVVDGEISKITAYGALVSIKENLQGILHTSEIAEDTGEEKAEVNFEVGDKIKAKVIDINPEDHRVALSIKALEEESKTTKKKTKKAKKEESEEKTEEKNKEEKEAKEEDKDKKKTTKEESEAEE